MGGEEFADVEEAAGAGTKWNGKTYMIKHVSGASLACNHGPDVTDLGIADGGTGEIFTNMIIETAF